VCIRNVNYGLHSFFIPMPTARRDCEACSKAPAKFDDILCIDCSRAYSLLHDLLDEDPRLAKEDLDRIREVYEWWSKKIQAVPAHR